MYQIGGKGGRRYETLDDATDAAESIFKRTGVVVSIGDVEPKPHYHVISGMPGYMPNANDYAATKRDAIESLRWWRDALHETEGDNEYRDAEHKRRRTGSLKAGWFRWDSKSPYDLGYYVEIVACRDDCDPDAEYD